MATQSAVTAAKSMVGETTFEASSPAHGVGLVVIRGEIDLRCAGVFRDVLYGMLDDEACCRVVLDIAAMPYLDSAGLGVIVETVRRLRNRSADGGVCLVAAVPFVRHAFTITRLVKIVTLCDSVEEYLSKAKVSPIGDTYSGSEEANTGR